MEHPQNHRIILPYLREIYDYGEYTYDLHSVSPDNKYIAIYLTFDEEETNSFTEPKPARSVLKLFKIIDNDSETQLKFCFDLLSFTYCDNLSIIWSNKNKLICEYQINSESYKLIYFNITDDKYDKYDNYKVHYVFADNETYKWEHSMSFSPDDSMLVTVYNRKIIRIFEYSAETSNYHFKTEETYDSNIYTITNIYLTANNRLIVSLYDSVHIKNRIVSYQINDDKTELQYLTEYAVTTSAHTQIFKSNKCTHDNNDYLLLLVTYGINYHSPSKIYIYDLTELKIAEIIDINNMFGGYMGYAYKMLFGTIENMKTFTDDKDGQNAHLPWSRNFNYTPHHIDNPVFYRDYTIPKLCYPITGGQTNACLINDKYIWISSGPPGEICKFIFNIFTKEKIFTAYSSYEDNGRQIINGRISRQYKQLHKTSNNVYVFTNDEQEPYKAMYNLNKLSQLVPITDIRFIHDTPTYVICEYNNKLWFGHSLPFCEEKNTVTITNLLQEYIPLEICHFVAKYCV